MTTEPASQVPIFSNDSAKPYAHICSWLDHIVVDQKPDDDQDVIAVALRKRHRPLTPVSPDQMDHPSKRHRKAMPDETVIAKTYRSGSKFTLSIPGSSIGSAASSSQVSPIKQLADRQNQVAPSAILQYDTDEADVPLSLHTMWKDLSNYSKGVGVIPKSQKARITTEDPQIPMINSWFYADDEIRNKLGNAPSVAEVDSLLKEAKVCSNEGYCEASWNMIIHQRVLQLAVPLYAPKSTGKVSFIPCPTAKIIELSGNTQGPSRKVDFCMLLNPEPHFATAIQAIQYQDPQFSVSINHTDYKPLRGRPIGLSIETKRNRVGLGNTMEQLSIWLTAQWRALKRLANRGESPQPLPEFLPGVVVEGHQWYFVASTRSGEKTILWTKLYLGTTEEAIGVYSIVCALQYIARWIETVYWPMFQRYVQPPLDQVDAP